MTDTLFYDIEVFKHQSMVVFKNSDRETVKIFTNSLDGLGEYIDRGVLTHQGFEGLGEYVEDKTLIGFNNYRYDDYILYRMSKDLGQEVIKSWNDSIILNKSDVNMKKINNCKTLDVMQQIDVSRPSLKKIEGNMGHSIYESKIPFDIDRKLTPKENLETVKYCENDVDEVITIYEMRLDSYFGVKKTLLDMLNENLRDKAYKWNTTSIIASILKPNKPIRNGRLVSDKLLNLVPKDVQNMWRELDNSIDYKFNTKKVIIKDFGNNIEFGWGGLHGAPQGVFEARDVKLLDVNSMYPNIIIALNGLGDKTKDYKEILETRLKLKKSGEDPAREKALKLILNMTYGLLNNQYSQLNKPSLAYSVCIYGQISLWLLTKSLANVGCRVFNINTDGVAFEPDTNEKWKMIWEAWERFFPLTLGLEEYDYWIQKDVNNYIAVSGDYVKTKGGDTNKYNNNQYFRNNDIRIVQIALVDYLVYKKDIANTIVDNLDKPILYQYVLQAGNTFEGTFDNKGNKLQKINRVFAAKEGDYEIYKKRLDGGLVKFADAPDKMYLYNGDLEDFTDFKDIVDLDWYYDLALKNLERWKV